MDDVQVYVGWFSAGLHIVCLIVVKLPFHSGCAGVGHWLLILSDPGVVPG